MQAALHGIGGFGLSVHIVLNKELPVTVGRSDQVSVSLSHDLALSGVHFLLELQDGQVLLRDLGSRNGTFVNGSRVEGCSLRDGDVISAGQSVFRLHLQNATLHPFAVLSAEPGPLFAILDAAREPRVLELLRLSGCPFHCLHQGKRAAEMEIVAPYLVPLASQINLLQQIVTEGWGKAWGVFFTCSQPVELIGHQLSRALMVALEGDETEVYFRYYDPRVLREILPILDAQQLEQFSGPIDCFLMEDEEPDAMLRIRRSEGAVKVERLTVTPETK